MDLSSSSCFLCHDPLPSIGLSYSFLLEPGSVFDSLCDLLQLPWLKSKEFCKIENSELCQVCLIQMQDVVNTIESIKMLEIKLSRLRYEMENTIKNQYCFETAISKSPGGKVRLSKNAINLSRLLIQCWSQCQVQVRKLTEDDLAQVERQESHESDPETEQFECVDITEEFDEKISQITLPVTVTTETEDSQDSCTTNEATKIAVPPESHEDDSVHSNENSSIKGRDEELCDNDSATVLQNTSEEQILQAEKLQIAGKTVQDHTQNEVVLAEEKRQEISVEIEIPAKIEIHEEIPTEIGIHEEIPAKIEIQEEIPSTAAQHQETSSSTEENQQASLEIGEDETNKESPKLPLSSLSTPQFEISELSLTHVVPSVASTPSLELLPETDTEKTVKPGHYSPSMRLQCKFCSKDFLRQSNLTVHIRKYHEEEGESVWPSCKKCGLDFKASNCFISTGSRKNNVLRCNLPSCRYITFKTIKELLAHHRAECTESNKPVSDSSLECSGPPEDTKCIRCHLNYGTCKIQTSPSKRPEFVCKLNDVNCTKNFRSLAALRKHHISKCTDSQEELRKKPRLTQKCPYCDLEFELQNDLQSHIKSTHDEGNPMISTQHACDQCGMSFENQFQLRRHFLSTHNKKFYLKCQTCNAGFRNHYQLQNHMQLKHGRGRKCEQCNEVFTDLKIFIEHRKSHADPAAQYVCETCGKCFNKLAKLNAHRARIHSDGGPTVPCPDCGKCFGAKKYMWSHVYRVHRKKPKVTLGLVVNTNKGHQRDEKKTENVNDSDALKRIGGQGSGSLITNNDNNLHNQVPEESPLSPTAPSTVVKDVDLGILTLGHDALMDVGVEVEIPLAEHAEFELLNQNIN